MNRKYGIFIDNQYVEKGDIKPVRSPWNGNTIAEVYRGSASDMTIAIDSAEKAFQKTKDLPTYRRQEILTKVATEISNRTEELATVLASEAAKPIKAARAEVIRAVSTFTIAAEECSRLDNEILPLDITPAAGDRLALVRRFPIGVIAGISPFNFPLNLVAHKVAPAIASGNTIVVKPASATPISALLLGEIVATAGAPPGTLNVIPCSPSAAEPLITDPRVQMITFTGSDVVGWGLKARCGKKKIALELGGNAALIVEPDANIDFALQRAVIGGYGYAGQVCIAIQRIFVHQDIFSSFLGQFVELVNQLKLGDPLNENSDYSAMIDEGSAIQTEQRIQEAVKAGGKLLCGGQRDRNRLTAAVLTKVPPNCEIVKEEAFAPVTVVESYDTFEEALERTNDSRFGLQAGVFTNDINKAMMAFNRLHVGGVILNDFPTYRVDSFPYGGVKDSGFGREGVKYAMEEMTERKVLVINNIR
jgi:acyl-CoA reductase-like NAD-dependent aldehyde dehydrogenase